MRVVYMAHPLGAPTPEGVTANIARAKRWYRWIAINFPNVAVMAPWVTTCEVLDDHNPAHRAHGMAMNKAIIPRCAEFWMVGGRVSTGMNIEMIDAIACSLRVFDLTWLGEEPPVEIPEQVLALVA
jgi:hypothetical protein